MSVAIGNSYNKYKQSAVETAPPEKLLLMLYDGAIKFLAQAKKALEKKNYEEANEYNLRVQEILVELKATLDMSYGEIPQRLSRLYDFINGK
ncbi:MAG: flagellar export chaperone FliS [Desulfitobacteriaceae bacterium]